MTTEATHGEARTRDGVTLSFTRYPAEKGSPRIVFVHSLALDRSLWSRVTEALDGRADMVAYDCRGHGRSGHPRGPYTTAQFADDLADLLDHLGWADAAVVVPRTRHLTPLENPGAVVGALTDLLKRAAERSHS
jgi:3-oxoadipate enol-lactonase